MSNLRPRTAAGWTGLLAALAAAVMSFLPAVDAAARVTPSLHPSVQAAARVTPSPSPSVQAGERTVTGRTVIADGHVDIGPRFLDGKWTVQVRDDTVRPPVWRNVEDVVLHTVDAAKVKVPEGSQFSFLGKPGTEVWVLPQVQQQGVLWPGWNTQDPQVASTINREVTWSLRGVTGPGRFALFVNGDFGAPKVLFDGSRPYPQQMGIDLNTHAHGNWVFSAPGTYLLDIDISGRTLDGRQVNDRRLLRIFVGAGSPDAAFSVPAPAGFVAGGTTPGTGRAESGQGFPGWAWLIIGVAGAAVVVAITITVMARRPSRRAAAAAGKEA
ncbi:TIGR03773 family transporter-associated surface protein [Actinomadura rudentiformis]|nr:TIGR03773 family transporter-associated surface protein [Actinomadura rudentiformis]